MTHNTTTCKIQLKNGWRMYSWISDKKKYDQDTNEQKCSPEKLNQKLVKMLSLVFLFISHCI